MLMAVVAGAAGGAVSAGGAGGGPAATINSVTFAASTINAGDTLSLVIDAANETHFTYQWTNAGADMVGETGSTLLTDGTWGSNAINCWVVAHGTGGASAPAEVAADATVRWVGWVMADGTSSTSAKSLDFGIVMPGQTNWIAISAASPSGDITIEGSGPTAIASHAHYKGNTDLVGNRRTYVYANNSTDQIINVQTSTNWGGWLINGFRAVGYSLTPQGLAWAGQSGNNNTGSTINLNVTAGDAIIAHGHNYDGVTNPTDVDFLSRAVFQQFTAASFVVAGSGIVTVTNASRAVSATRAVAGTNKHFAGFKLVPV